MGKSDSVLDAGTGSGIAAIFFSHVAKKVVSYERREDFADLARKNVQEAGIDNLTIITGDVLKDTGRYDVIHLDLGLTSDHIIHARALLFSGGYLACYSPFFEQMALAQDIGKTLFSEVSSYECIMRDIDRSERGTRPSPRVCHSGYITIMRG